MNDIRAVTSYLIGVDLGKKRDFTAISALRQYAVPTGRTVPYRGARGFGGPAVMPAPRAVAQMEHHYDVIVLDRWRDRSYRDVVPAVQRVMGILEEDTKREHRAAGLVNQPAIPTYVLIDATGVGIGVVDDFRFQGLPCVGITITSGNDWNRKGRDYNVPKHALVTQMELLIQNHHLDVATELPHAATLVAEMDIFKSSTTKKTGHDSFGAAEDWREHAHDDLVLSVAMAAWYGQEINPARYRNRKLMGS